MDLDIQVNKLKMLKSYYLSQKYDLEDKIIKFYPKEIALQTEKIKGLKADLETQKAHPKEVDDKFVGMTINGVEYADKAEAGKAIIEFCKVKMSADDELMGCYRGFKMDVCFDSFERAYVVTLKGAASHHVSLGIDNIGEKPFAQEDELRQKMARLTELNALLDMNKGDVPVVGGEPDEGDNSPEKNRDNRNR